MENLTVTMDGVVLDPKNDPVTLTADTITTTEDAKSTGINVLSNDSIPDRARSVTYTQPPIGTDGTAHGTVTLSNLDLTHPATGQVAQFIYTPKDYFQKLGVGQTAQDTFTYTVTDANGDARTATVTINVTGINDAAVIMGTSTGAVMEAGGVANGISGMPTASGTLTDTDIDNPANTFTAVPAGHASTGGYGTYAMTTGGLWSYTLDNTNTTVQALNSSSPKITDTFTVTTVDGTPQIVSVAIQGANDAPVAAPVSVTASEDGPALAGLLNGSDVDAGTTLTYASTGMSMPGLTIKPDGSYRFDPTNEAFQHLAQGSRTDLSQAYAVSDAITSTTGTITVSVNGTNDNPTAIADALTGTQGSPVTFTAAQLTGNDTDPDDGEAAQLTVFSVTSGNGGTAVLNTDGTVTFTPTESGAAAFGYVAQDTHGARSNSATANVTVAAAPNQPVVFTDGADRGTVTEDAPTTPSVTDSLNATGTLSFTDADPADTHIASFMPIDNATRLGTFYLLEFPPDAQAVNWQYALNNAAAQYLNAGQTVTENYRITVSDGHGSAVSREVGITIVGTAEPTVPAVTDVLRTSADVLASTYTPTGNIADNIALANGASETINAVDYSVRLAAPSAYTGMNGPDGGPGTDTDVGASPDSLAAINASDAHQNAAPQLVLGADIIDVGNGGNGGDAAPYTVGTAGGKTLAGGDGANGQSASYTLTETGSATGFIFGGDQADAGNGGNGGDGAAGNYIVSPGGGRFFAAQLGQDGGDAGNAGSGGSTTYRIQAGAGNDVIIQGDIGAGGLNGQDGQDGAANPYSSGLINGNRLARITFPGSSGSAADGGTAHYDINAGDGTNTIVAGKAALFNDGGSYSILTGGTDDDIFHFENSFTATSSTARLTQFTVTGNLGNDTLVTENLYQSNGTGALHDIIFDGVAGFDTVKITSRSDLDLDQLLAQEHASNGTASYKNVDGFDFSNGVANNLYLTPGAGIEFTGNAPLFIQGDTEDRVHVGGGEHPWVGMGSVAILGVTYNHYQYNGGSDADFGLYISGANLVFS